MPGRYGAPQWRRTRVAARRITTLGCSTVVLFGGLCVLETTTLNRDDVAARQIEAERGEDTSRGASREIHGGGSGPVVVPTTDPNVKPAATAELPAASGSGRRVVYDITGQQVWLVEADGTVARTYKVSGSRYDQVPEGTYEVFSASRNAISWHGTETMEYMVRFHRGENSNIGFHDIPVSDETGAEVQTLSQLATPLSDGCIRQDVADAVALWEFAPVGTAVVVVRT